MCYSNCGINLGPHLRKGESMKKGKGESGPKQPFMFQFAETVEVSVVDANDPGTSMEIDTKDPYSDSSDTV